MKKIAVLGSTGSIGTQTLEIVRDNKDLLVTGLAVRDNIDVLEKQIREFHPLIAGVWDEKKAVMLRERIRDCPVKIVAGMDGLIEIAQMEESDMLVTALVGMIGIKPTIAAIESGKDIALANKETLVTAGHLIMPLAKEKCVKILPIDSEHSAVFQVLNGEQREKIAKLLLTASGGPFRGRGLHELENITVEDALNHPNWKMGKKTTVDSSTMINKGLEVIEAKWLFDVDIDQIEVIIQPQSIIHSMVQFIDGAVIAQLGVPDMKLPIQYALYHKERKPLQGERLDFAKLKQITFEEPDMDVFKGLKFAYQAGREGGSMPTVLNSANELAVARFLERKITYLDIATIIEYCLKTHTTIQNPTLAQILETEQWTHELIRNKW